MAETYTVVVRHNLVAEIRRSTQPPPAPIPATPLEVSSQLAANNLARGCIDGEYHFSDAARARVFALLCLEFTRALLDRRHAAIEGLRGAMEYRGDGEPLGHGPVSGAP